MQVYFCDKLTLLDYLKNKFKRQKITIKYINALKLE